MPLTFIRLLIAAATSAALVLSSPSYAGADQDPASFGVDGSGHLVDDEAMAIRPTSVYPGSSTASDIAATPAFCVDGNRGELVTMYCAGYSGMCPKWIRAS